MISLVLVLLAVDMGGAARDLARGVAAAVAHEPAALSIRNVSSLGPREAAEIGRVFESELKPAGAGAAEVQITISENPTQFLLVAEIHRGDERHVMIESWPRAAASAAGGEGAAAQVTLEKKLLWEQDQPILDAAQAGDALVVLDAEHVLRVRGSERQSAPIPLAHPWPRDLRGRLSVSGTAFTAWLPGTLCRGALEPQFSIECRESQEPWLIGPGALATFATPGNFFQGRIDVEPGGVHEVPPFYAAAPAGDGWILAGTDGRARVYTHSWQTAGEAAEMGSDVASIDTPCGGRVIATRPSGPQEPDAVQPFEITGGAARPSGKALEFSGSITALWSAGSSATAVVRDLQTGRYAAFSLAPACGR